MICRKQHEVLTARDGETCGRRFRRGRETRAERVSQDPRRANLARPAPSEFHKTRAEQAWRGLRRARFTRPAPATVTEARAEQVPGGPRRARFQSFRQVLLGLQCLLS
jgi:hypothetical protein